MGETVLLIVGVFCLGGFFGARLALWGIARGMRHPKHHEGFHEGIWRLCPGKPTCEWGSGP